MSDGPCDNFFELTMFRGLAMVSVSGEVSEMSELTSSVEETSSLVSSEMVRSKDSDNPPCSN